MRGRTPTAFPLLAGTVLWGTTGTASALAGGSVAPPVAGAARLMLGGLVLIALLALTRRQHAILALAGRDARWWTVAAAGSAALYQATFFSAIGSTGVAVGTLVVLGSAPIACGLLARWWLSEALPPGWLLATALALAGCVLMILPGGGTSIQPVGVILACIAGACYGVYTVSAKRLLAAGFDPLSVLAGSLGLGALFLAPVLLSDLGPLLEPRGMILAAWLGVVATALAYILFARGLGRVPAATAGTLSLAEPLTAAVLGLVVLGERPPVSAGLGALLLLAGLILAAAAAQPRKRPLEPVPRPAPVG